MTTNTNEPVALKPCPFCRRTDIRVNEMRVMSWVHCNSCRASGPACDERDEAIAAWNTRVPAAQQEPVARSVVSIMPMALSDGRTDYFVSIQVGDKNVTPHVFREEHKAAYHVALYDWLLNGAGEEPDLIAFGPDEWPAQVHSAPPDYERIRREALAEAAKVAEAYADEQDKTVKAMCVARAIRALAGSAPPQEATEDEIALVMGNQIREEAGLDPIPFINDANRELWDRELEAARALLRSYVITKRTGQ